VGGGLFALTEGYYAVRQRGARLGRNLWWVAGLVAVAGLSLIRLGLGLAP
jgi:hypothetical protein